MTFRGEFWTGSANYRRYEGTQCRGCAFFDKCVSKGYAKRRIGVSVVERQRRAMRAKLASEEGKRLYALRKQTVEPVFGQIKSNLGLSKFLLYGLEGATAEVGLMCMVHNVRKCMASKAAMAYIAAKNASALVVRPFGRLYSILTVRPVAVLGTRGTYYPAAVSAF